MATALNRNIIVRADAEAFSKATSRADLPRTFAQSPPAGVAAAVAAAPEAAERRGPAAVPSEDDFLTRMLKYVPTEVLGAYLFMAGVIDSNVKDRSAHAIWLGGLLVAVLIITAAYDRQVLSVVRWGQIAMSVVGMAVYVFALGGWFATTTWYHQWYASIAVPAFAMLVAIIRLKPLPATGG